MIDQKYKNPFQITSPEDLSAEETVSLFVDVFTDLHKIIDPGHVFIIGPRGTGKSMMFRYLQPDCQCISKKCALSDLPFLGVYVPLKNTNFALSELKRFEQRHASDILNEHIMATHFGVKIFNTLANPSLYADCNIKKNAVAAYYYEVFLPTLQKTSSEMELPKIDDTFCISDIFSLMAETSEKLYFKALNFAKRLSFSKDLIPYEGPLCDYVDFLVPLMSALANISGFPKGRPIYLLIDDAHCLTETQARVLNSWVATRTSRKVSLKISTQYNYKTIYTTTGATIDTPHDFSEIDIATIYTGSNRSKYRDRIADIVKKRLEIAGIKDVTADQFFPDDEEQENAIRLIADKYKEIHDKGEGKGFYRADDASRYSRPDFIKSLAGQRKSSSSYSYSGFNQLVHLSSGIVRHFLHPAHHMYAITRARTDQEDIRFIPASIQNEVMRDEANSFLFSDIERIEREGHGEAPPKEDIKKLFNLIQGLGGLFRQILLSDRSERRVFSIAFSEDPPEQVKRIFELGIQLGYFHKSTIGRKDSKSGGRTRLYVLNRRLAPIWNLDPNGFAGYLFMNSSLVKDIMEQPQALLRRMSKKGIPEDEIQPVQLELF